MTDTPIPADLRKIARAIANVEHIAGPEQDDLTAAIAEALLAERRAAMEQAARIVTEHGRLAAIAIAWPEAAMAASIAAAIRKAMP